MRGSLISGFSKVLGRRSFQISLVLLSLFVYSGCQTTEPDEIPSQETPEKVHVAFAGGGWRAHTAHAAWTMTLLDHGTRTLDEVFANVETISSNSGGTWFNTMLVYSEYFRSSIEAEDAIETYATTGYLAQQKDLLGNALLVEVDASVCDPLQLVSDYAFFYCELAVLAGGSGVVWSKVVDNIVFAPRGMNQDLKDTLLSGLRQDWAAGKSLLMAGTMLTRDVVLNENDAWDSPWDKRFYRAKAQTASPQINLTPVTFSSTPEAQAPPFLAAGGFNMEYTENALFDPAEAKTTVENPLPSDGVRVLAATAASSAAVGAAASKAVLEDFGEDFLPWQMAYELSDLALPFALSSPFGSRSPVEKTVEELADSKFIRVADGGYLDNSGVAQLVSYLQLNDKATDFQIVAFDNVQELYEPASGAEVGADIAALFGKGLSGPDGDQVCVAGFCVKVPSQQIFVDEPLENTPALWQEVPAEGTLLVYTRYQVKTLENKTLGIKAGSTGTLHAFTCYWPSAPTAPIHGASDFIAYEAMLNGIYRGLAADNARGLKHLRAALEGQ